MLSSPSLLLEALRAEPAFSAPLMLHTPPPWHGQRARGTEACSGMQQRPFPMSRPVFQGATDARGPWYVNSSYHGAVLRGLRIERAGGRIIWMGHLLTVGPRAGRCGSDLHPICISVKCQGWNLWSLRPSWLPPWTLAGGSQTWPHWNHRLLMSESRSQRL